MDYLLRLRLWLPAFRVKRLFHYLGYRNPGGRGIQAAEAIHSSTLRPNGWRIIRLGDVVKSLVAQVNKHYRSNESPNQSFVSRSWATLEGQASMSETIDFQGRVAIVTGGARGLGAAYVRELAQRGAAVVVHDLGGAPDGKGADPRPAHEIVESIAAAGGRAVACTTDASTSEGGRASVQAAIDNFGRLDAVIANAGIIHSDELAEWPTERFEAHIQHHLLAAFHVIKPAFAVMKSAGYGRLVFVSSAAGVFGQPGLAGYATAKTAMLGLMNVAAIEGAEFGIKANAIMPMGDTRMARALMGEVGESPGTAIPRDDAPGSGGPGGGVSRK